MAAVPKGTIQFEEYFKCRRRKKNTQEAKGWGRLTDQQVASLAHCLPS